MGFFFFKLLYSQLSQSYRYNIKCPSFVLNHLQTYISYFSNLFQEIRMEKREDLRSILEYLPLVAQDSSLVWSPSVEEELQKMSRGPSESMVNAGEALASHITNMRKSLSYAPYALQGYAFYFDKVTILLSFHLLS